MGASCALKFEQMRVGILVDTDWGHDIDRLMLIESLGFFCVVQQYASIHLNRSLAYRI